MSALHHFLMRSNHSRHVGCCCNAIDNAATQQRISRGDADECFLFCWTRWCSSGHWRNRIGYHGYACCSHRKTLNQRDGREMPSIPEWRKKKKEFMTASSFADELWSRTESWNLNNLIARCRPSSRFIADWVNHDRMEYGLNSDHTRKRPAVWMEPAIHHQLDASSRSHPITKQGKKVDVIFILFSCLGAKKKSKKNQISFYHPAGNRTTT